MAANRARNRRGRYRRSVSLNGHFAKLIEELIDFLYGNFVVLVGGLGRNLALVLGYFETVHNT